MNLTTWILPFSIGLFVAMIATLEAGFRLGQRDFTNYPAHSHEGLGVIDAAVFALLGLLLAFSFAAATSRLDTRRQLIVQEANAIGTAYLRLGLLPAAEQSQMQTLFRNYLDARLAVYENLGNSNAMKRAQDRVTQLQGEIWAHAIAVSKNDPTHDTARLLLPAINEMLDVATARTATLGIRLPLLILSLLTMVAWLSGLLAGYAMAKRGRRSRLHAVLYAAVITLTVYTVLDLDNPRSGLIRISNTEDALQQMRDTIK